MENLFTTTATAGEALFHFSWLPLLIWTVAALTGWLILRTYTNLHPQIQYSLPIYFRLPESANSNPSVIELQPYASATVEEPTVIERRMTVQFNQISDRIT